MHRVVLAEHNAYFRMQLAEFLRSKPEIDVVGCAADGLEAEAMIDLYKPDLLLLDLVMPRMDGFDLLCGLHARQRLSEIDVIVMTQLVSDALIHEVAALGVLYYLIKPFEMECLYNKIKAFSANGMCRTCVHKDARPVNVSDLVTRAGIHAASKGYRYLCDALSVARDEDGLFRVTKDIYPKVAKRYGVHVENVERAIRCAIDKAWRCGSIAQSGMFTQNKRPTNAEMIAMLSSHICADTGVYETSTL